MRWIVSTAVVSLLASSMAAAAPQRSSNLGVRVTVVRSCAIKTNGTQAGASVTCSAGQIAPVITTALVPAPPAAPAPAPQSGTTTVSASTTAAPPATATARPAISTPAQNAPTVASDDTGAAEDADEAADAESTPDTVRVVTINF